MPDGTTTTSAGLWDFAHAFDRLAAFEQRRLGIAALLLVASEIEAGSTASPATGRAWDTAGEEARQVIMEDMASADCPFGEGRLPLPDLALIGVRACHACGCTDERACPEGCSWVGPNLCSTCAPGALPPDGEGGR